MSSNITAAVLIIGNEILTGRTQDANVQYLGQQLFGMGIKLQEVRVVRDDEAQVVEALNALRKAHTYIFTTGGIGPTHDDITAACVAKAFGRQIDRNAEAVKALQSHYTPEDLNEARLSMADMPVDVDALIENPISKAAGFRIENVYVLAGVPKIMQAMFEGIKSTLQGGAKLHSQTVTTTKHTEGTIADQLRILQNTNPDVEIGSYPYFKQGDFGVSLVVRGEDKAKVAAVATKLEGVVG